MKTSPDTHETEAMRPWPGASRRSKLATSLLLVAAAFAVERGEATGAAAQAKAVRVDCTKPGGSIAAALKSAAPEVVIEIRGLCHERVLVQRSGVTLRGADPAFDGLVGPVGSSTALLEISDASLTEGVFVNEDARYAVTLENLSFRGNDGFGMIAIDSHVQAKNCRFHDNAGTGAHVTGAGLGHFLDTAFERNGASGLSANRAALVVCERCTLEDNTNGLSATNSAVATLVDSVIEGTAGVNVLGGASVTGFRTTVDAVAEAFFVNRGDVRWFDGSFSGTLIAFHKSFLRFGGVVQTANPGVNFLRDDTTIFFTGGTLLGTTILDVFSNGRLAAGAIVGDLVCDASSDLVCDAGVSKTSSSCGLCP